jgi:hypothetical protein
MAKYFYRRGQKVPVAEVQGVVGVRIESATSAGVARGAIGDAVDQAGTTAFARFLPKNWQRWRRQAGRWCTPRPT